MSVEVTLVEYTNGEKRAALEKILEESFQGLYLWHAKKTLYSVEKVFAAEHASKPVGVIMLKNLLREVGYIYYVAVATEFRSKRVGSVLLEHALEFFRNLNSKWVLAAVEEDNLPSMNLFESHGFKKRNFAWIRSQFGVLRASKMVNDMRLVPGEILLAVETR
ncbi:MAG: GNAT family N-acetyltransferase [Thermoprotei archaeon]